MGGKSAVEIAEQRLKADQVANSASGYGGGGYQGISIPIDYSSGASTTTGGESLKVSSKGSAAWGNQDAAPK